MNDNYLNALYGSLKNRFRIIDLSETLRVLWAFMRYKQFNKYVPRDIQYVRQSLSAINQITEWELEILAREAIINSPESKFAPSSFRNWIYFTNTINALKNFENEIAKKFIRKDNVLAELYRISHRQFPWQTKPDKRYITRYLKIFSYIPLSDIIKKKIGLTTKELYLTGILFIGGYINHFTLFTPININIPEISQDNVNKFIDSFSCKLNVLKKEISKEQEINEKFAYFYSSLRAYPIIKMRYQNKDSLACLSSTLLIWRLTNGIYYNICKEKNFGNFFGKSFQDYIGEVIKAGNKQVKICPEEEYRDGKNRKDTADWIVDDGNAALLIECKTKRITMPARTEIKSDQELKKELNILADAIIQLYKSIKDYRQNKYQSFKFQKNKKIFPLVITLEEWYFFGDKLFSELDKVIKQRFKTYNLPLAWLSEMPYSLCSAQEFEIMIQIIEKTGTELFMNKKVYDSDKNKWGFFPFIHNVFPEENKNTKFLFPDDFDKIFPKRFFKDGILNKEQQQICLV